MVWRRLHSCPTSLSWNSNQNPEYTWESGPGVTSHFLCHFWETVWSIHFLSQGSLNQFLLPQSFFLHMFGKSRPSVYSLTEFRAQSVSLPHIQKPCSHDHLLLEKAWSSSLPLTEWARFLFSMKILLSNCKILPWKTHYKDVVRRNANNMGLSGFLRMFPLVR